MMDFAASCIEEIALEGLDGITLPALWLRLSLRSPPISLQLDDESKEYLWSEIISVAEEVEFYELTEPRPSLVLFDRFKNVETDIDVVVETGGSNQSDIYPISIIGKENVKDASSVSTFNGCKGGSIAEDEFVMGSCSTYTTRRCVSAQVRRRTENADTDALYYSPVHLTAVTEKWGDRLVVVASQRLRNQVLFRSSCNDYNDMLRVIPPMSYALLERIGRSRYMGEASQEYNKVFNTTPKNIFYMRKLLRKHNLITVQDFNVTQPSGSNIAGKLCHLKQFYVEYRPKGLIWLHDLTTRLAGLPNHTGVHGQLRVQMGLTERSFRKLCVMSTDYIQIDVIPHREFYPDATPNQYTAKNGSERKVRIIRLLKEFRFSTSSGDADDGEEEEEEEEGDDNESLVSYSQRKIDGKGGGGTKDDLSLTRISSLICEQSLFRQFYNQIDCSGARGLSQSELRHKIGMTHLDTRLICKNLVRRGSASFFWEDVKKHRVERYVAQRHSDEVAGCGAICTNIDMIKKGCEEQEREDETGAIQMKKETKNIRFDKGKKMSKQNKGMLTARSVKRMEMIVQAVNDAKVIDSHIPIVKKIREMEDVAIDRKTVKNLFKVLCDSGKISCIKHDVTLKNGSQQQLVFYCHPSISTEDSIFQTALRATINKVSSSGDWIDFKKDALSTKTAVKVKTEKSALDLPAPIMVFDPAAKKRYGVLPRMARFSQLHKFLWFLVYDQTMPSSDLDEDEKTSSVAWQRHILPLTAKKSASCSDGLITISDALIMIPVFMFCQIIAIPYKIDGLEKMLNDKEKRLTPISLVPHDIYRQLTYRSKHVCSFVEECRHLARLGLISRVKQDYKELNQTCFYIHRNVTIIDTTLRICDDQQGDAEPQTVQYHLSSYDIVENFWLSVQTICTNTPQVARCAPMIKIDTSERFVDHLEGKLPEDIKDDGHLPGDGLGAGGFDSTLFTHRPQSWGRCQFLDGSLIVDKQQLLNKINKKRRRSKKTEIATNDENTQDSENIVVSPKRMRMSSISGTLSPESQFPTIIPKKQEKIKVPYEVVVQPYRAKKGGEGSKQMKPRRRQNKEPVATLNRKKPRLSRTIKATRDPKDRAAYSKLRRQRVLWTTQEDSLLLLCRLTSSFLSDCISKLTVPIHVIRDIMHETFEVSKDKTGSACKRRIMYMMKCEDTRKNVCSYLLEALQDRELVAEFRTGKKYVQTNVDSNAQAFRACLARLRDKFRSGFDGGAQVSCTLKLPNTREELLAHYLLMRADDVTEHDSTAVNTASAVLLKSSSKSIEPQSTEEIYFTVLHNVIHSTMVLTDKSSRRHELYQLLKTYPESILNRTFISMKDDGIITKIKKCLAVKPTLGTTIGTYQLSQRYAFKWNSSLYPQSMFASIGTVLAFLPPPPPDRSTANSDISGPISSYSASLSSASTATSYSRPITPAGTLTGNTIDSTHTVTSGVSTALQSAIQSTGCTTLTSSIPLLTECSRTGSMQPFVDSVAILSLYGSDFFALQYSQAHAVLAVSLMADKKIIFETTVPEQVVVIDSVADKNSFELNASLHASHGSSAKSKAKKPRYKYTSSDAEDSDAEEEDKLIQEAQDGEREGDEEEQSYEEKDPNETGYLSSVRYLPGQSSRTVLSMFRCQYVHSQSIRLHNPTDNVFVNSCNVRAKLKKSELRDTNGCISSWDSYTDASRDLTEWNRTHTMIHPKSCDIILRNIRSLLPLVSHTEQAKQSIIKRLQCRDANSKHPQNLYGDIYKAIKQSETMGLTPHDLRTMFLDVSASVLREHLDRLVETKLIVRVGTTKVRYMTLDHAQDWTIVIEKNVKGRGVIYEDANIHEDWQADMDCTSSQLSSSPSSSRSFWKGTSAFSPESATGLFNTSPVERSSIVLTDSSSLTSSQKSVESTPAPTMDVSIQPPPVKKIKPDNRLVEPSAEASESLQSAAVFSANANTDHKPTTSQRLSDNIVNVANRNKAKKKSQSVVDIILPNVCVNDVVSFECDEDTASMSVNDAALTSVDMSDNDDPLACLMKELAKPKCPSSVHSLTFPKPPCPLSAWSSTTPQSSSITSNTPRFAATTSQSIAVCSPHFAPCKSISAKSKEHKLNPASSILPLTCLSPRERTRKPENPKIITSPPRIPSLPSTHATSPRMNSPLHNTTKPTLPSHQPPEGICPRFTDSQTTTMVQSSHRTAAPASDGQYTNKSNTRLTTFIPQSTEQSLHTGPAFGSTSAANSSHSAVSVSNAAISSIPGSVCYQAAAANQPIRIRIPSSLLNSAVSPAAIASQIRTFLSQQVGILSMGARIRVQLPPGTDLSRLNQSTNVGVSARARPVSNIPIQSISHISVSHDSNSVRYSSTAISQSLSTCHSVAPRGIFTPATIRASSQHRTQSRPLIPKRYINDELAPANFPIHPSPQIQEQHILHCDSHLQTVRLQSPAPTNLISLRFENLSPCRKLQSNCSVAASAAANVSQPLDHQSLLSPVLKLEQLRADTDTVQDTGMSTEANDRCISELKMKEIAQLDGLNDDDDENDREEVRTDQKLKNVEDISQIKDVREHLEQATTLDTSICGVSNRSPSHAFFNHCDTMITGNHQSVDMNASQPVDANLSCTTISSTVDQHPHDLRKQRRSVCESLQDDSGESCPAPKGTYRLVRLIPRPWRTPEGNVNKASLRIMLEALVMCLMECPGIDRRGLIDRYHPVLQPVPLFELLEILEVLGCVRREILITNQTKPSLFSPRLIVQKAVTSDNINLDETTEVFHATSDCVLKLGQFITQLISSVRTVDEKEASKKS